MASSGRPNRSQLDIKQRLLARADWVGACEAALELRGVEQFLEWMDRYVRPLVGYRVMACGTGVFLAAGVNVDRLLLQGLRQGVVDRLRDERGTVVLPRAWSGARDGLRPVDLALVRTRLRSASSPRLVLDSLAGAAMERSFGSRQRGSYFLFAAPAGIAAPRVDYGMRLLGPHMHDALLAALACERAGVNERQPVKLTRTEQQILSYLVAGLTSAEIARASFRSPHTVANQIRTIISKFNAHNRTEAVAKALGLGLVMSVDRAPHTRITAAQSMAAYLVVPKPDQVTELCRHYRALSSEPRPGRFNRWVAAPHGWRADARFRA